MMKTIWQLTIILVAGLISCQQNRVYESHKKDFPNNRWDKQKVLEFAPEITDTTATYRIYLALRHVYGFQFETMKVKVTSTTPTGKSISKDYVFQVIGQGKKYISDCAGDICDLETVIEENVSFNDPGTYKYTIEHQMPLDQVLNVMEFGLIIEKHKNMNN